MSSSLANNVSKVTSLHRRTSFSGKAILFAFVTASIIVVNLLIRPNRFDDYDSYIQFTDYIYHYAEFSWIYFEPLSSLMLFTLRAMTGSTEEAVNLSHYLLGFMFTVFCYCLVQNNKISWQGYIVFIALYGLLLAFVTFRATPAYLLVAIAFFNAMEIKKRSFFYIIIASLFHISALLALPLLMILFYESKFFLMRKLFKYNYFGILIVLIFISLSNIFGSSFFLIIIDNLANLPFLGKYISYFTRIDAVTGAIINSEQDNLFHVFYAIAVSLFTMAIIISKNESCIRIRNVVLIGYLMFIFMQFSPVSAFRQSIFWMTPALLIYPWSRLHFKQYGVVPFVALCVGLAVYQFQSLYL
jgi:EpsG family